MRSQLPEHALVTLLRQCYITPKCQAARHGALSSRSSRSLHSSSQQFQPRTFSSRYPRDFQARHGKIDDNVHSRRQLSSLTIPDIPQEYVLQAKGPRSPQFQGHQITQIAVLGGGITGLSTAYYLMRELPHAKVTIYEGSEKLGGWLQSKRVEVEGGSIVFEQGPRTLRPGTPAGLVTLEMIKHLGLEDQLLITSSGSDAARNRFIYYPDHLVKMPSPGQNLYDLAWSLLTEPVFKGMFTGALFEVTRDRRPTSLDDESIGSFLERRLGSRNPGDNIVSAVLHGIYAGDIYQLSVKSLIPRLWYLEGVFESITQAGLNTLTKNTTMLPFADMRLRQEMVPKIKGSIADKMQIASVYTFKEGIGALSEALKKYLRNNPRVEFKLGQQVSGLEYEPKGDGIMVKTANGQPPQTYTHAISTLSGKHLSALASSLPELARIPTVTVMVVNLYYRSPYLLPERGFGYLIPRSIPFEQNPECALGVVFDSDSTVGQDTAPGTKVTVMLGGHWWDSFGGAGYPSSEEGVSMAKAVLRRHLGVTEEPETTQVGLQKDCIPQYVVGHEAMLKSTHSSLLRAFRGKLSVAGNTYTGVGLNDCVRAARDVVLAIKDKEGGQVTGLEEFRGPRAWAEAKIPSREDIERAIGKSG